MPMESQGQVFLVRKTFPELHSKTTTDENTVTEMWRNDWAEMKTLVWAQKQNEGPDVNP